MKSQQRCTKCQQYKPIVAFALFRTRAGEARRRGICAECRGVYFQENFEKLQAWRRGYNAKNKTVKRQKDAQRRAEGKAYVDAFKNKPCTDCGRMFPSVAMDLDHVRGAKVRNVASFVSGAYRLELIIEELEKCEVVCACCHRVRTAARKANHAPPLHVLDRTSTSTGAKR